MTRECAFDKELCHGAAITLITAAPSGQAGSVGAGGSVLPSTSPNKQQVPTKISGVSAILGVSAISGVLAEMGERRDSIGNASGHEAEDEHHV